MTAATPPASTARAAAPPGAAARPAAAARPPAATSSLPERRAGSDEQLVPPVPAGRSRRDFFKLLAAVGVGVGLTALDGISTPFARRAGAQDFDYQWWTTCLGFFSSSQICVPTSSYFGADLCWAWGHELQHFFYEGSRNWSADGNMYMAEYQPINACGGRNAWIWDQGSVEDHRMCSDGTKDRYTWENGDWEFDWSPGWAICRTPAPT